MCGSDKFCGQFWINSTQLYKKCRGKLYATLLHPTTPYGSGPNLGGKRMEGSDNSYLREHFACPDTLLLGMAIKTCKLRECQFQIIC